MQTLVLCFGQLGHSCEAALPSFTGTLTQNKMAASRLWVAGQEVEVGALTGHSSRNGATPQGLEPKTLSMLVEGVALNSTAELRDNGSESSASTSAAT